MGGGEAGEDSGDVPAVSFSWPRTISYRESAAGAAGPNASLQRGAVAKRAGLVAVCRRDSRGGSWVGCRMSPISVRAAVTANRLR